MENRRTVIRNKVDSYVVLQKSLLINQTYSESPLNFLFNYITFLNVECTKHFQRSEEEETSEQSSKSQLKRGKSKNGNS